MPILFTSPLLVLLIRDMVQDTSFSKFINMVMNVLSNILTPETAKRRWLILVAQGVLSCQLVAATEGMEETAVMARVGDMDVMVGMQRRLWEEQTANRAATEETEEMPQVE